MMHEWKSKCGRYTVRIPPSVKEKMVRLATAHLPNEVGTALIGDYSTDGYVATVTKLTPVSNDSKGGRTSFHRGSSGLREFFRSIFRRSRGQEFYIGEWHSHPGGTPFPSSTDDRNVYAITKDEREYCKECVLVILAIGTRTQLGVYVYSSSGKRTDLTVTAEA